MKITLLFLRSKKNICVNKDINGGFGTATSVGNSLRAKLIEFYKKKGIKLPLLSLGYAAAILRNNGHIIDYKEDGNDINSDMVIIASSMVDYKNELNIAQSIKERNPKVKIGFIGPFASVKPEIFLDSCDFIICGEPEEALSKIKEGKIPKGIIKSNSIKNLDSLPFPDWDGFPVKRYSYAPVINEKPFLTVQSSRGCGFSCGHYCPYIVLQGRIWRDRSVENVISEIIYLKKKYKIRGLLFRDPLFSYNKKRAKAIAEGIIKNDINIKWACETRVDMLDKELIDLFYVSGLRAINIGIESFDETVLKKARRSPIKKAYQEDIIKYCHKKGIKISAFYILGLLTDTKETIKNTIKYAKKLNTYVAQFTINTPIPGTEFFKEIENKLITEDWEKFDNYNPVFKHPYLSTEELSKLKERAFVSYYFRPAYLIRFIRNLFL